MTDNNRGDIDSSVPSKKELDIALLKREKEKLEEYLKKNKIKIFLITGFVVAILGAVVGFFSVNTDSNYYYSYSEIVDSLKAHNIHKDDLNNNYIIPPNRIYTKTDSLNIQDSLSLEEQKIRKKIESRIDSEKNKGYWKWIPLGGILGFLVGWLYVGIIAFGTNLATKMRIRKINQELLIQGAQELKDNIEKDFFTKLVEINFKYLDQYYLQTQEQADKSFLMCVVAAGIGFVIISTGIIMMFQNPAKVEPAYVTTASGVLSEFIAAVFFYLYNKTLLKMSQYHQKLVITQNISLALKTADALKDSKEKVLETIIDRLTNDVNKHLANQSE